MQTQKKKYISFSLPADLLAWLQEQAAIESRTRSNLIVKLLQEAKHAHHAKQP
jgi:hypothetical protein|nr:MAG TPA: CopG-like protein [Caudoviricetes sp.]DAY05130.1 MAG TPA: CopG-like protein [Caudoviricetes sp.]